MMGNPPWTDIGRVESDIQDVKRQLHNFAKSHEIYEINRRLDSLECTVRELNSKIDGMESILQETADKVFNTP